MAVDESRTCKLGLAAGGAAEPCPRERCAFWEAGGAVLDGGCVLDRVSVDLNRPNLAAYLVELRDHLDAARDPRALM